MGTAIQERLRLQADFAQSRAHINSANNCREAADYIDSLEQQRDEARAKAIEECATLVEAVRLEFVSAGAEIVASGNPHEIMPEAVADNLTRIASAIRALNGGVKDAAIKEAGKP